MSHEYLRSATTALTDDVQMKKKKRPTKVNTAQSDDEAAPVAPVLPSTLERINLDEANLVDDDDLQASLARSRREAAKKRVTEMKERKKNGMDVEVKVEVDAEEDDGDDVIVMDDTSEFVRNISLIQARPPPVVKSEIVEPVGGAVSMIPYIKKEEGEEDDTPLTELAATSGGWGPPREDGEESDSGDVEMNAADVYGGDDLPNAGTDDIKPQLDVEEGSFETTGSTETLVSRGMASTLNLLRHQGLLETRTPEQIAADLARKTREAWIWAQRRRDEEREEERRRAKEAGGSKDQGQREYENRMRDAAEARQAVEAFGNYEPVVDIKYHDEFGRDQTPKEVRFVAPLARYDTDLFGLGLEAIVAQLPRERIGKHEDGEAIEEDCRGEEATEYGEWRHAPLVCLCIRCSSREDGKRDHGTQCWKQRVRRLASLFSID